MTIKRATFYNMPPEAERLDWCDWLKYHTIDPVKVLICGSHGLRGFIEINTALYRIRHLSYDDSGFLRDVCVQLEAMPSDFPQRALGSFYTDVKVLL